MLGLFVFKCRRSTVPLFQKTFPPTRASLRSAQQMPTLAPAQKSSTPCLALEWRISIWMQTLVPLIIHFK